MEFQELAVVGMDMMPMPRKEARFSFLKGAYIEDPDFQQGISISFRPHLTCDLDTRNSNFLSHPKMLHYYCLYKIILESRN